MGVSIKEDVDATRGRVLVWGKRGMEIRPSSWIAKPPWPRGPRGRKTETMTSLAGSFWMVRRWK